MDRDRCMVSEGQALACEVCGSDFVLEYPFQLMAGAAGPRAFCSMPCRTAALRPQGAERREPTRIAVFNHKGGTGKTTTAINLAAGLAEMGRRVLLVDADGQGNVGASLGVHGERSLYHVLVQGESAEKAAVPVRNNLDVLTSNETLAAAELYLVERPNRDRVLRERLRGSLGAYDAVIVDCAPALSLMNQNAMVFAQQVVIPVSCDYLSLVGVRQVMRTLRHVRELLNHPVELLGVVPTFFDQRTRVCREALDTLREHFGERCLPPIRVNTRLREAPSAKQTIFEYAPTSHGALDYMALVQRIGASDGTEGRQQAA
jgi:chromosome partitioning protein